MVKRSIEPWYDRRTSWCCKKHLVDRCTYGSRRTRQVFCNQHVPATDLFPNLPFAHATRFASNANTWWDELSGKEQSSPVRNLIFKWDFSSYRWEMIFRLYCAGYISSFETNLTNVSCFVIYFHVFRDEEIFFKLFQLFFILWSCMH